MKYTLVLILISVTIMCKSQIVIRGIVTSNKGEIANASIFAEWSEGNEVKRNFTTTLPDGSFWLQTKTLPFTLTIEHSTHQSKTINVKDSSFLTVVLVDKVNTLNPLVLNGIRQNNLQNNTTTLNKKDLSTQNSALDLPLIIKFQPSVVTTTDAGNGVGYSGIRIRGTDATRINVTLNGIPMNDAESQGVWWVNTPDLASGLDNVQITRGVGSSTNGSGSFGGTLSMETDDPSKAANRAEIAYGSFNTLRTTVAANTGLVGGFSGGIRVSNISSDGYIDRASSQLQALQVNLAYQTSNTKLRFIHLKGSEKTYQAWYGLDKTLLNTDRTFNVAGIYMDKNGGSKFYENQTDNYNQSHYQFFVDRAILNEEELSINTSVGLHYTKGEGYYEEYKENQLLQGYNQGMDTSNLVRQLWLLNDLMGVVYTVNLNTDKLSFSFGGAANTYIGNHFGKIVRADNGSNIDFTRRYYDSDATKSEWTNYLKASKSIQKGGKNIKIFGDIQYRAVNYQAVGVNDDQSNINFDNNFNFINPKIGITIATRSVRTSKTWDIFLGTTQREPARSDFIGSPNTPKAERLVNLELGRSYLTKKWALIANYYMMYYQNQLVLTGELNNVGTPLRENAGESYRTGLELIGQWKVNEKWEIGANLTVSQNRILEYKELLYNESYALDTIINRKNSPIAYSPNMVSGIQVTYEIRRNLNMILQNKFVGKQYLDNTGQQEKSIPLYNTTNLIINYRANFRFITQRNMPVNISAYFYNITNSLYENNGWAYSVSEQGTYTSYTNVYPQAPFNAMLKVGILF